MKRDVVKRSEELDKKISRSPADIEASIDALVKASKSNRRLINWVIVSMIFEFILAVAVIYAVVTTQKNNLEIERNKEIIMSNCQLGNEFRTTEKSLWQYILSFPPTENRTPDDLERVAAFKAYLDKNFATKDCDNL